MYLRIAYRTQFTEFTYFLIYLITSKNFDWNRHAYLMCRVSNSGTCIICRTEIEKLEQSRNRAEEERLLLLVHGKRPELVKEFCQDVRKWYLTGANNVSQQRNSEAPIQQTVRCIAFEVIKLLCLLITFYSRIE